VLLKNPFVFMLSALTPRWSKLGQQFFLVLKRYSSRVFAVDPVTLLVLTGKFKGHALKNIIQKLIQI